MSLISVGSKRTMSTIAVIAVLLFFPALNPWLGNSPSHSEALAGPQRMLFSTYLGGQDTQTSGIAVDQLGNVYVTGVTRSASFPHTLSLGSGPGFPCVFVTKINPGAGTISYSVLIPGTTGGAVAGIAVDDQGSAYIAGTTVSRDFPATAGAFQAAFAPNSAQSVYVIKLDQAGSSISYATLLGGGAIQAATSLAVDGSGKIYVTGTTNSPDFPTTPGAFQTQGGSGFVSKINADGSGLDYSTLFGGSGQDSPSAIAVDLLGNATI